MKNTLLGVFVLMLMLVTSACASPQISVIPSPVSAAKGDYTEFNVVISDSIEIADYFVKIHHGGPSYVDAEYPKCTIIDVDATSVALSCSYYVEPEEIYDYAHIYVWAKNVQGEYSGRFVDLDVSGIHDPPADPPAVDEDAPDTTITITSEAVVGATMRFSVEITDQSQVSSYIVKVQYGSDGYVGTDYPECNATENAQGVVLNCAYYLDPNKDYTYARIYVWAKDVRGNYSGTYKPFEVTENTPPTISVSVDPPAGPPGITFRITANAQDDAGLQSISIFVPDVGGKTCSVSGAEASCVYEIPGETSIKMSGEYFVLAEAVDIAGLEADANATFYVGEDEESPTVTITSPEDGSTFTAPADVTVSFTASDNTALSSITINCGNGQTHTITDPSNPYTGSYTCHYISPGTYTITVTAKDIVENSGSDSVVITVSSVPDTTPPTITSFTVSLTSGDENTVFTISCSAQDNESGLASIQIYVDNTLKQTCTSSPCSYASTYPAGTHTTYCKATDNAGNEATSDLLSFTVTPSNQPPTCSVSISPEPPTTEDKVFATVTASDDRGLSSANIYLDGSHVLTCSLSGTSDSCTAYLGTLSEGEHTVSVAVYDSDGASGTCSKTFTVIPAPDTTIPTVTITSPEDGSTFTAPADVTVSFTASDNTALSSITINCGNGQTHTITDPSNPYTGSYTCHYISPGTYTITVTAKDPAGNTGHDSVYIRVVAPPTNDPPTVRIVSPEDGAEYTLDSNSVNVVVEWSARDPDGRIVQQFVRCSDQGIEVSVPPDTNTYTCTYSYPGSYAISVRVFDDDGASATDSVTIRVIELNAEENVVAVLSVPDRVEENTQFFVHVYAYASAGLDTVAVYRNGENILFYADGGNELNVSIEQVLSAGTYAYKLVVRDVNGRIAEDTATVIVTPLEGNEVNVHVYELTLTPISGTIARVIVEGLRDGQYVDVTCTDITYSIEALDSGISSHECRDIMVDDHRAAEIVLTGVGRYRVTVTWQEITKTVAVIVLRTVSTAGVPFIVAGLMALLFFLILSRWVV